MACDLFHVDQANLQRVYVFYVMDVRDRMVHILGVTPYPTGEWTVQAAREFAWRMADRVGSVRYLIRDRAGQFTDRMLLLGQRHLEHLLGKYVEHCNTHRAHRALDLRAPADEPNVSPFPAARIARRPLLDGLISEYETAAQPVSRFRRECGLTSSAPGGSYCINNRPNMP